MSETTATHPSAGPVAPGLRGPEPALRQHRRQHRPALLQRDAGEQSGANPRVVIRAFRELPRLHGELRRLPARTAMV